MDVIREATASIDDGVIRLPDGLVASSFSDEVMNDTDVACLTKVLTNCQKEDKPVLIGIIAELAKKEENRALLANVDVFNHILNEIMGTDNDVVIKCFRAIGNICFDNDEGRRLVMTSGHIDRILEKFKFMAELSDEELGTLPRMACGCIHTLTCGNESLQLELVKHGAIPIFFNCLQSFIKNDSELAKMMLEVLSGLVVNEAAKEQMIEFQMIEESISLLKDCKDNIAISILDLLTELIQDDDLSDIVCSQTCLLDLLSAGMKRPSFSEKKSEDKVLKKLFDSMVLFTSNESFDTSLDDRRLLNQLLELLKCENMYVQTSAALAIGNFARNDMICTDLVNSDCHKELINFLKTVSKDEDSADQMQAVFATLKNISIPVPNKPVLAATELPDIARQAVKTAPAAVQFKAIALLRLLVQGQSTVAIELCNDESFLQAVADSSSRETLIGLCAEARRLTAALVKNCQSSNSMSQLIKKRATNSLIGLLSSEHSIMQNEALVAMVTLLSCGEEATRELMNAGGIEISTTLLKQASNKPHLVFNLITLFTAICQDENGKKLLQSQIMDVLEQMAIGPNEVVRNRSNELLRLLQS